MYQTDDESDHGKCSSVRHAVETDNWKVASDFIDSGYELIQNKMKTDFKNQFYILINKSGLQWLKTFQ